MKASCGMAALFCCVSYHRSWENRVTFGPISIIPKGWRQLKSGNGIKSKTIAMHFLFTILNSQRLCKAQDVLTQRKISFKAREQQGHNEVLSTRGLFLTQRSFVLGFCEHFISPSSPLRTLQRAGFLGLSPVLQREAPSWSGQSVPFLVRWPTAPAGCMHQDRAPKLQRCRPTK